MEQERVHSVHNAALEDGAYTVREIARAFSFALVLIVALISLTASLIFPNPNTRQQDKQNRAPKREKSIPDPRVNMAKVGEINPPAEWLDTVKRQIEQRQYHPKRREDDPSGSASYLYNNRRHGFESTVGVDGWELKSATGSLTQHPWSWRYNLKELARGEEKLEVKALSTTINEASVTIERDEGLSEWYRNGESGIEQGFTIPNRPLLKGAGNLNLRAEISTNLKPANVSPQRIKLTTDTGFSTRT